MKIKIFCIIFLLLPAIVYAQGDSATRYKEMEKALNRLKARKQTAPTVKPEAKPSARNEFLRQSERKKAIEETLRKITIELTFQYLFAVRGKQEFDLVDPDTLEKMSRLYYPIEGKMPIFKGEIGFLSKIFIGGRYGSSNLHKKTCTDEDWGFWDWHNGQWSYIEYQITKQVTKPSLELFDVNLYYRLLDFDEKAIKQRKSSYSKEEGSIFDFLLVDRLSFDVFAGYQSLKGRYKMMDPMLEASRIVGGTWWYAINLPADIGLDSFYRINYKGPRFGFRTEGSKGKFTTKLSFAYALLKTEAHGWWNLRDFSFWHTGRNGYGLDVDLETTYKFTPHLLGGMGFICIFSRQEKLKYSGIQPGFTFSDLDMVRNAENIIYSPSVILKFIW